MTFDSLGRYAIKGRRVISVQNPTACNDFKHLIGITVEIDGKPEVVVAVEHFAHLPPYQQGENIGLMVL